MKGDGGGGFGGGRRRHEATEGESDGGDSPFFSLYTPPQTIRGTEWRN